MCVCVSFVVKSIRRSPPLVEIMTDWVSMICSNNEGAVIIENL